MPTPPTPPADPVPWSRHVFWAGLVLSLLVQGLIYGVITNKPVIRSDGMGYHMYLPALADGDLSLRTLEQREFPKGIPYWTGTHPGPAGYVIKYPPGEALLQAPFFLLARLAANLLGLSSAYAFPYQWATAISGACYFAWGCRYMWQVLRQDFAPALSLTALGLTVLGTNLLHYATYDAGFSHVYSFFLASALLALSFRLSDGRAGTWIAVGALAGLTVMTRPTNAVFVLFVAAVWLRATGSWREGLRRLHEHRVFVLATLATASVPVILQLAYWKVATGHWLFYAYGNEGFRFLHPAGFRVLFSLEKGWFVYLPLTAVAVGGWIGARRKLAHYLPALPVFAMVNIWVIASWHDWGYGGSFSIRPLVDSSVLVSLGLAGAFWRCAEAPWRQLCTALCAACTVYTLLLMAGYWMRSLPYIMATGTDIVNCLTLDWLRR